MARFAPALDCGDDRFPKVETSTVDLAEEEEEEEQLELLETSAAVPTTTF